MIDLNDSVCPCLNSDWIYRCYKAMPLSDLCKEYLAVKNCMDILVDSDVAYGSWLSSVGDYLLDVIRLVMAEWCVERFVQ